MTNEQTTAVDRTGKIPFGKPTTVGRELEYIAEAIRNGTISGDGPFSHRCVEALSSHLQSERVCSRRRARRARDGGVLSGVGPGDEVIVPSFTFVSTANAVRAPRRPRVRRRRPDPLNVDARSIEAAITPRTRPWSRVTTPGSAATWRDHSSCATGTG